jgi:heparin binding hemagglutinin HbhA
VIIMASMPNAQDIRKAREQAAKAVSERAEIVKTPLLAALGAGEAAAAAAVDALTKARSRATESRDATQARAEKLQERISELPTDLGGLRSRLNGEELRKLLDTLAEQAKNSYVELAQRGESTWERIRQQPQVAQTLKSVQDASSQLGERVDTVAETVLSRVSRNIRSTGEKTANTTEKAAAEIVDVVQDTADDAAHTARSTSRKAANRTAPRKPATPDSSKPSDS